MQTRLKVIIGVGIFLICGALLFIFLKPQFSNSKTNTTSSSKPYNVTSTSGVINQSKACQIAEKRLQEYVKKQFNSLSRIEIGTENVKELSSYYKIEIKGNASGYVDAYNDDFNKMTFTFSVDVEKDGGYTKNAKFNYKWKY